MPVSVRPAVSDVDRSAVLNFFVAYLLDLSRYDDNLILNEHGLPMWEPFGLPGPTTPQECAAFNWWIRGRCLIYVIAVAEDRPAGFAVVCADHEHVPPEIDFEMLDFYIAPKYRGQGVGRAAAGQIFERHRGVWQVLQLARNRPAIDFWHRVIGEITNNDFEILDDGAQQRFSNENG